MTTTVIDEYILPALVHYREQYQWSWNISMRIINRYYGTEYTEKELKALYKRAGKPA